MVINDLNKSISGILFLSQINVSNIRTLFTVNPLDKILKKKSFL